MQCIVTATRNRDLSSSYYGTLAGFRFHRNDVAVDWFEGQVKVTFPCWAIAQQAVNQLRQGNATLWDSYCVAK